MERSVNKIGALDGLRGIAILSVLFSHFVTAGGINLGRVGVELFFVLSGRLMAELLFVRKNDLAIFLKRRISRVWPALFVMVIVTSWIAALPLRGTLHALTFTSNYASAYGYRVEMLDHIWSLCIEEHVYIFLAILAFAVRRWNIDPAKVCFVAAIMCMAHGTYLTLNGGGYYEVYWRTDTRAASILISTAIYLLLRKHQWVIPTAGVWFAGITGLLLNINLVPDPIKYSLGTICLALAVSTIEHSGGLIKTVLCNRATLLVGLLSYSLYLWQQPFCKLIGTYPLAALFLATIVCAVMSYWLIEKPCRDFLNRVWAAGNPRPAVPRQAIESP